MEAEKDRMPKLKIYQNAQSGSAQNIPPPGQTERCQLIWDCPSKLISWFAPHYMTPLGKKPSPQSLPSGKAASTTHGKIKLT